MDPQTPPSPKPDAPTVRFSEAGHLFALGAAEPLPEGGREKAGDPIGRYRLIEVIGEGGFGMVWRAEQYEPVRREVALKLIKLGMDSREIIARFEAERQALALMEHPNIAGVLDAGTTESGRPYFVMELVKGTPITTYCNECKLNICKRRTKSAAGAGRKVKHLPVS
jgi:serine/threonine protein kinase